jgi:hypothetical protein
LPSPVFDRETLKTRWPLLCECCSLPLDLTTIRAKAEGVGETEPFLRVAEQHGVVSNVAEALRRADKKVAADLQEVVHSSYKRQSLAALSLCAELFRVTSMLQQAGVEFAATKGPVLAVRAYGDPGARRYFDLDILVSQNEIFRACELLASAGYAGNIPLEAVRSGRVPGEYIFHRGGTQGILELHTERSFRFFPRPMPIEDFFRRKTAVTIDGRPVPALSLEDEFVLISIHGAKHFWERLMWISDVAAIVHRHPQLDWTRVRQSAVDVGAERMVRVALLLSERLLRVAVPAEMKREVTADAACLAIVKKIETWLPFAGQRPPALIERALFRFRMRGQMLGGARYLTRLSLSPTEEDWLDAESKNGRLRESLSRPFRLARKYRRDRKETN